MDIKNSPLLYPQTCGLTDFPNGVTESVKLIMSCGIDYEFRTTVVRELHSPDDINAIGKWIRGAKKYFLHKKHKKQKKYFHHRRFGY